MRIRVRAFLMGVGALVLSAGLGGCILVDHDDWGGHEHWHGGGGHWHHGHCEIAPGDATPVSPAQVCDAPAGQRTFG